MTNTSYILYYTSYYIKAYYGLHDAREILNEIFEWCAEHNALYSVAPETNFQRVVRIINEEDKLAFKLKFGQHIAKQENAIH